VIDHLPALVKVVVVLVGDAHEAPDPEVVHGISEAGQYP
jgi:hypothetical protein